MKTPPIKSQRGVYYDLKYSPYEYETSYGEIFKFSSAKKLEIYTRELPKRIDTVTKNINKIHLLTDYLIVHPEEQSKIYAKIEKKLYKEVEV
jgi:hypothetical protein